MSRQIQLQGIVNVSKPLLFTILYSNTDLPFDVLSIAIQHLSQKDRAAVSLSNREFYHQFPNESPTYFAEKFGIHAIDRLFMQHSNNPYFVDFAKRVIGKIPGEFHSFLLNLYAYKQEWSKVEFMLSNGFDPSLLAYSIKRAATNGFNEDLDNLRKLVGKSIDVDAIVNSKLTEMHRLLPLFGPEIGAVVYDPRFSWGDSISDRLKHLLCCASGTGRLNIIELLISDGADIHADDDHALRIACENGDLEIVQSLLSRGADIHAKNNCALAFASIHGHLDVVGLLLTHGANVNAQDSCALRCACCDGHLSVVQLLLEHGADIHAEEEAALRKASIYGYTAVVELLLARGAIPDREMIDETKDQGYGEIAKMLQNALKRKVQN